MKTLQKRWSFLVLLVAATFFVGCSGVQAPASDTEADTNTDVLESQAFVYDWVDTSNTRGVANVKRGTNFLSDVKWLAARNGLGPVQRNKDNSGGSIRVGGTTYTKGLGVHADSNIIYDLNGKCSQFSFVAGFDDSVKSSVSVKLFVRVDGRNVFSGTLSQSGATSSSTTRGSVSITGADRLQLLVSDLDNGNSNELVNWADAKVVCN
jgi:hypothetical protein